MHLLTIVQAVETLPADSTAILCTDALAPFPIFDLLHYLLPCPIFPCMIQYPEIQYHQHFSLVPLCGYVPLSVCMYLLWQAHTYQISDTDLNPHYPNTKYLVPGLRWSDAQKCLQLRWTLEKSCMYPRSSGLAIVVYLVVLLGSVGSSADSVHTEMFTA